MTPIIHQLWLGPMPDWIEWCIQSWRDVEPTAEHVLWTESTLRRELFPLANQELWDNPPNDRVAQFRSDVARYEILNRVGGIWVDADFEARKPVSGLDGAWATWEIQDRWVANGMLAVPAGHPVLADAINSLPGSYVRSHRHSNSRISGPRFFTPLALKHGLTIYPQAWFYPYAWADVPSTALELGKDWGDVYAVHHWHNRRQG